MPDYTTPELVLERLRLPVDDVDAEWVAVCVDVANTLVDGWLDRTDPASSWPPLTAPYPAPVVYAATGAAIRAYRGKDASSDVADSWGSTAPVLVPRDLLAGFVDELAPYRNPAGWVPA